MRETPNCVRSSKTEGSESGNATPLARSGLSVSSRRPDMSQHGSSLSADDRALEGLLQQSWPRRPFPDAPRSILIYGAGKRGRQVRRFLDSSGYSVVGFLDQNAVTSPTVDGLPSYSPDDHEPLRQHHGGAQVVMGVYRCDIDVGPIARSLQSRGYDPVWLLADIVEKFGPVLPELFWLTRGSFLQEQQEAIHKAIGLFEDEESRRVFLECIKLRALGDLDALSAPDQDRQYLPTSVPAPRMPLRMVDGGAFTGDTYRSFRNLGATFDAYAAFEPETDNFRGLADFFRHNDAAPRELALFPCGLWSSTETLRFSQGSQDGSHLDSEGQVTIQCVALDQALPTFRPNFLKLDIEGAEAAALAGARKSLIESRPQLAISAYHRPADLWEIPRQVADWQLDYRLYLRHHNYQDFDVVLYAVPDSR